MRLGTKPTAKEGNYLFLLLTALLLSLGGIVQGIELYSGLLISQYALILLPVLIFIFLRKYSLKDVLRLNKTSFKNIILAILIAIFTYPIAIFFNLITTLIIENYGTLIESPIRNASNGIQLLINFLVISITPGICEEVFFRGLLLSSYENFGKKKAIFFTGILFGVFHFNFQNLLGPMVLGIVFAIMVFKTDSILVAMVGHATNNLIAVLLGFYIEKNAHVFEIDASMPEVEPNMLYSFIIIGFFAILAAIVVKKLIGQLDEGKVDLNKNIIEMSNDNILLITEVEKVNIITVLPILIIFIYYILQTYLVFFKIY